MNVFVYFGVSVAKTGVFIDIFTYRNVRKSTVFFNPSISNQMTLSFLLITVVLLDKYLDKKPSERYTQFSALVFDFSFT